MTGTWLRSSSQRGWRSIRAVVAPAKRAVFGTVPRAEKEYATHVPVLVGIASVFKIQTVLELGCGEFSTLTFLNRSIFPDLVRLDTFENDRIWLDRISHLTLGDSRLKLNYAEGDIHRIIRDLPLEEYDLVFVDDSTSAQQRARTIAQIAGRKCNPLVVIHDFEVQEYQKAALPFQHCYIFRAYNPMTGVVWNGQQSQRKSLKRLHISLKRFARTIEPDDMAAWRRIFSADKRHCSELKTHK